MQVAHFVQRYPPALGGSEAYFARLSRHLTRSGDRVTVFTTTALDLEAFWSPGAAMLNAGVTVEEGVEVRRYGLLRWPGRRYILKPLSFIPYPPLQCLTLPCNPIAWRMWQDAGIPGQGFDVVHATAFPYAWPIAAALRMARTLHVPFVLTPFLHTGAPDDQRDRVRKAYTSQALLYLAHAADRVFVQTRLEEQALVENGIACEKLMLQGMGVAAAECTGGDRQRARRRWGMSLGETVVGHLANNSREKGTVDLLEAAERVWMQFPNCRLVLAGPEMPNFRRFWQSFRSRDRVLRLGVLDEDQKRDFFAGIDLFALPSRSDSFGLVLLEAWANGVPSVAYRCGGVAEVIHHEEDGLLVACGDLDTLAAALCRLVGNVGTRRELGTRGKVRTRREFQWEEKLALVRSVYGEEVRKNQARGGDPRA